MKFDQTELENTAKAVIKFNKYAAGDNVPRLVSWMQSMAHGELAKLDHYSYVSTYGFVLSSYPHPSGEMGIKASVCANLFHDIA